MYPTISFNRFVYLLIFLVGALNYALMLGTLNLVVGSYPILPSLDLLRTEASFFLFLAFLSACYLIESSSFLWLRRIFFTALLAIVLLIAHMAAVLAQSTSEAGPMHKVLFYVNYLHIPWLSDHVFEFILLYAFPVFLFVLLILVYVSCLRDEINGPYLKQQFHKYFSLAILFLALGFVAPFQKQMPYSLSHNALLYLLKTGYFPQQDIYKHDTSAAYSKLEITDSSQLNNKNVVLIILESTQKKAIYIPGHEHRDDAAFYKGISPYLSELSSNSMMFDQAYGSSPHTSKALVSIHCGILPYLDLAIYESVYGLPVNCLPELLEKLGYQNVFIQGATGKYENRRELLSVFGYQDIYTGEDLLDSGKQRNNPLGLEDLALIGKAENWLDANTSKPFLMSLLTLTSHHPYSVPKGFASEPYLDDELENAYLNSIRYQDTVIREFMDMFKKRGLYDNTLFVFVSDHGEAFGEHGEQLHNNVAYNEVAQVFFMIHDGSQKLPNKVIDDTVSQLQILPTLMDILNVDLGNSGLQGSALSEQRRAFGSCYERIMCFYYANNNYKYIFNFREKVPELFDIKKDPLEMNNLTQSEPEITQAMHDELMAYYDFHQSAMHNYYLEQNPAYIEEVSKTVLYSIKEMKSSLNHK